MKENTIVLYGPGTIAEIHAKSLSKNLGVEPVRLVHKIFPDGESYVRIPEEALRPGNRIILVHNLEKPQDKRIFEALLVAHRLQRLNPAQLILYTPYMAYSRQDKEFLPGEAVSAQALLETLHNAGYTDFATIEIHKPNTLSYFPGQAVSLDPFMPIAEKLLDNGLGGERTLVVSPDLGARHRATRLASMLGSPSDYLVKRRDRHTGEVIVYPKETPAKGRHIVIVDDMIATGGTMARAARLLLNQGAETVTAAVAHALLVKGAKPLLDCGIQKIYAANTLEPRSNVKYVDVSDYASQQILEVFYTS